MSIIPRYKLLVSYDIQSDQYEAYYRYMMGEFVPTAQQMGLYIYMIWHVAYGDYPVRQIEFVGDDLTTMQQAVNSDRWGELENRLKTYATNYKRKLIPFRDGFQF
jgi:hypothetical protein